jgi:hypothetical protein
MGIFTVTEEDMIDLKQRLEKAFGAGYEVEIGREVSALMGTVKLTFDMVIFYQGDAICGIEYKHKVDGPMFMDRFQDLYIERLKKVGLPYGFYYAGADKKLYLWRKGLYKFELFDFDDMVTAIKGNQMCGNRIPASDLCAEFMAIIPDKLNDEFDLESLEDLRALFAEENLEYDEKSAMMWLNAEAEDELFRILLQRDSKDNMYKQLCRYTSLNSLFLTMRDGNQVMCSITCMNDKGETSYADKYVGYGAFANSTNTIKENNDCFILSCCEDQMADNLTMWRLYGNDGKGVCLEYDVDTSKMDNKEFFLAPVSYGVRMDEHPALDYIKMIRHWTENGWRFELKRWYIWKHFFKSHLFREEKEVRLLYIWTDDSKDKVEWIMDSTNSIVSRICKFPISSNRLPLTLKRATIGPKCPEQESNVDQFNYMNEHTKTMPSSVGRLAVGKSKIEDYR